LLGYQYTITASSDAAKRELAEVATITSADKLVEQLIKHLNQP
jgi:hypothetical protein